MKDQGNDKEPVHSILPWRNIRLVFVALFWGVMVFLLWRRDFSFLSSPMSNELPSGYHEPFVEFLQYENGRESVGITALLMQKRNKGFEIFQRGSLEAPLAGQNVRLFFVSEIQAGDDYRLSGFSCDFRLPQGLFHVDGRVSDENTLEVKYGLGSLQQLLTIPVPDEGIQISSVMLPILARDFPFEAQRKYSFRQFNPLTTTTEEVTLRFGDQTEAFLGKALVEVLPLEMEAGGVSTSLLVTRDGRTIKETSTVGVNAKALTQNEALFAIARKGDPCNLLAIVPFGSATLSTPLDSLVVRLDGISHEDFQLETRRQHWSPARTLAIASSPRLEDATSLADSLTVEPTGISTEIDERTAKIIGSLDVPSFPREALGMLADWVITNVSDNPIVDVTEAGGRGRVGLFIDLARSASFPASAVTGLVYEHGAFFVREWVKISLVDSREFEFELDNSLTAVDASHIQLLSGTIADRKRLTWLLANLKISVEQDPSLFP